jgi:hypothetical protein
MTRVASLVCEKCGFRTQPYDPDDPKADHHAWREEMNEHSESTHGKYLRYHNTTHIEFWSEYKKEWYR